MLKALILALLVMQAPQYSADEKSVYDALLKDIHGKELPAVIVIRAIPFAFRDVARVDASRFGTSDALNAKVRALSVDPFTPDAFPAGTRFINATESDEIFNPKYRPNPDAWKLFGDRFKAQSIQGFSRALITDDGLDAWVTMNHSCGTKCGQVGYAWLHRDSRTSPWVVKRVQTIAGFGPGSQVPSPRS